MKKKSWVKLLSMLMVVAMMMSVCMVQAFAAVKPETEIEPNISGVIGGYTVTANLERVLPYNSRFNVSAVSPVNMGVYCKRGQIIYQSAHVGDPIIIEYTNATASYYGYDLDIPITLVDGVASNAIPDRGWVPTVFGYNGDELQLSASLA